MEENQMNKSRQCFFDRGLAALLASLMLYMGCAVPATAQQPNLRYDGETIFRGVFLDDGPVTKLFPEIWENPTVVGYRDQAVQAGSEEQAAAGQQALIAALRAQDPTFFDRFGKEMQSGDRIRIKAAMTEARNRLIKEAGNSASPSHSLQSAYYYKWVAVWLAVAVAVAVALVLVIEDQGQSMSGLQRDVMVDLVAKRLGPQAATAQ
jgi:SdpC family antimicrobial peptide